MNFNLDLVIPLIFFLLFFTGAFYFFRYIIRRAVTNHLTGKMDLTYKAFIVCGCLSIILSLYLVIKTKIFVENATMIQGKVIQLIESDMKMIGNSNFSGENSSCYMPVFSYVNSNNVETQMTSKTCQYPPAFAIGDKINLLLNADNPDNTLVENEWFALWGSSTILGISGCSFFLVGSLGIFTRKRQSLSTRKS